jgi:TATA-box binding protein (TBP) (component of TFIID and TFIIIB)
MFYICSLSLYKMLEFATKPIIHNVKISFNVSSCIINDLKNSISKIKSNNNSSYKEYGNYITLKTLFFYSIWKDVGKVNITGIREISLIPSALSEFAKIFQIDEKRIENVVIDNIFASGSFKRAINLRKLKALINSNRNINKVRSRQLVCDFNQERFPAAYCRRFSLLKNGNVKRRGIVSVFGSGKYNILGAKCEGDVADLFHEVNALILKL